MRPNPKLICIIGRTCSGKDTLSFLFQIYKGIEPLVSYTTRPKRDYEDDGEEHYFITEDEYEAEFRDQEKLAYTEINGYKYFTLYDQLTIEDSQIHTYVIDPTGYYELRDRFKDKIDLITIYVECPSEIRERRYQSRESNITVPFDERDKSEDEQFLTFEEQEKPNCDLILNTRRINLLNWIYD